MEASGGRADPRRGRMDRCAEVVCQMVGGCALGARGGLYGRVFVDRGKRLDPPVEKKDHAYEEEEMGASEVRNRQEKEETAQSTASTAGPSCSGGAAPCTRFTTVLRSSTGTETTACY